MSRDDALADEIAKRARGLAGRAHRARRADGAALVRYEEHELGILYRDRGEAELPFLGAEHDELIERGDAEQADATPGSYGVSHGIHGPADVTAVLELFERRYRDLRGEDDPYSSQDPG